MSKLDLHDRSELIKYAIQKIIGLAINTIGTPFSLLGIRICEAACRGHNWLNSAFCNNQNFQANNHIQEWEDESIRTKTCYLVLLLALVALILCKHWPQLAPVQGERAPAAGSFRKPGQAAVRPAAVVPQPAQQDPCLHCHIVGENKGIWTPLARWSLFSSMGLLFVFGMYRSASVWKNRTPWVPLPKRAGNGWMSAMRFPNHSPKS
jgi:hypothetical protein